ncbi:MAG: nuclear transport factor 2 family protein [Pseudolabrys sp.]|nr:nuclear transport factor 2 family protein [Pseudolabrys sp.]
MHGDERSVAGCRCEDCAIRRTLARYNIAGDRGDLAGLAACFTEQGVLRAPGINVTGRAAIVARLEQSRAGHSPALTRVQHNLTTSLIEIDAAANARCRSYFFVLTDIGPDHAGSYHDQLVRVDGEWLIAERSAKLSWLSPDSLFTIASD